MAAVRRGGPSAEKGEMAAASHPDGGRKTRWEDEEGEEGKPSAEAAEDRISALPEALRLQVLCLLPLKSAIRTGVLSTQWRELWTRRWPAPSSLDFFFPTYESSHPIIETLDRRGLRRLDRFALSFGIGELEAEEFRRCLYYAAACAVEDLRVHHTNQTFPCLVFQFRLPLNDPHLTRLSLRGITVCTSHRSCAFSALEVIDLRRVYISNITLLLVGCPLLRTLDLRHCAGLDFVSIVGAGAGAHLTSLTVAECQQVTSISADGAFSLRSFRYSGAYVAPHSVPVTSALADLCICFTRPAHHPWNVSWYEPRYYSLELRLCGDWLELLTNLSNLTVLTLCSNALRMVSAGARARSVARNAAPCKLHNLRELQLLMFAMSNENMDDIYVFLMNCRGPRLERLFVQLPTRAFQCAPKKELDEDQSEAFENLMLLKMINFRGRDNEMRLVRLVLKKSTRLNQLILFTPTSNHPKGLKKDHMDTPQFIETKLLSLRKASPNAQIILSEPDDSAIEPLHCQGFVKVK